MRAQVELGILLILVGSTASAQEVPEGIRYLPATAATNARAEALLHQGLLSEPYRLAKLQGRTTTQRLLVGPFLSGSLVQSGLANPDQFVKGKYQVPLDKDVTPEMPAIGAEDSVQRAALDLALSRAVPRSGTARIRKLRPSEMALIWFYISWDISEPVFVVEQGNSVLVVDFDEAGESIVWIEDISRPCFRVTWEGGGLMQCFCSKTVNQGNRYNVVFEANEKSDSCSPAAARGGSR
jgi:hypothetical protein